MATPIQEPNDIPSGEITDANAGNYAVVVYKKDTDGAGLKKLGLAPWKQFLGFNSHKVTNVATWVGVPEQYYDVDTDQDPPQQTLVARLDQLRDNSGVSDQPQGSGFIPLNTRVGTLEDTVGTPTSGGVLDGTTVCAKVEENSGDITDIETFLGDSSSASGSNNVSGRLQSVEGKVNTLQTEVETASTGLLARATAIESILGTPSSGSVIVPGSNSVCQQVEHNTGEIEELWDSIGGGGGGGSSSLTSRIESLENTMPTKTSLGVVGDEFNPSNSYTKGNYVYYNELYYRFTQDHTGDWDDNDVINITVSNEFETKQNATLDEAIAGEVNIVDILSVLDSRSSTNATDISELTDDVGNISNLTTTNKTNVVAAINELNSEQGTLSNLTTANKSNLVAAINEVDSDVGNLSNLTTTNKSNIVNAINEIDDILNNSSTGIIPKVGALDIQVGTNTSDISTLKSWVGNSNSAAGDPDLSGRMLTAENDISTLKQTASSAYVLMGTITGNITPSSSGWDWANMKTGWVYNVNPASGDTVDIQVPGASSSQTFYKGANLAWIKKEDAPSIPETYGYFDELGTTFDLQGIEDRIDVVENDIGDLQDDVTDLQNRFKTTYFPTVWDSTNLTGTYLIIGNNSGKTGGFIGVFSYGTLTGGLHTDIGTDVFGTTTGVNFFNLNSQTLMVSALTGVNVTAVKLS